MDLLRFYERAVTATAKAVAGVRDDQLAAKTPCAEWDVRALGNHVVRATWTFAGRAANGDEDYMAGDRVGAFRDATAASLATFSRSGASEELSLALLDMVVHGWDLAKATGQNRAIDVDLAGAAFEVAKRVVGHAMRETGSFGLPLPVGDDAPVHERLVAFLGRTP